MSLKSINPFTNLQIGEFEEFSDNEIHDILNKSSAAFKEWEKTDYRYRKSLISQVARTLIGNAGEYARSITEEMGKPIRESKAEVEKCAWVCNYYAQNGEDFLKNEPVITDASSSYVSYEPLGTILGIMPWNFPFWQVFRFAVPTLLAGNTVLLKHASNVQICARHIENIFTVSRFPTDVFRNLVIGSARVKKIIENDIVRGVSLTGSEYAGQKVAETAGSKIKKSLLELGGSNAFVVLEDADLEKASEVGIKARMSNAGQSCIAAKRFIIHEKVSERFLRLFLEKLSKIITGDPSKEETGMGPLASIRQAETIDKQVQTSVQMGARLIEGGKRDNAFYAPSVLMDVKPGMPVFDEEVFGPVAAFTTVHDYSEAVDMANATKFGLGVSIFTNDMTKVNQIAREFKDGAVFVNELVKSDPRLPFGGTWRSGYGRELSQHGIREFVNVKTVYIK
jgi:succinate-semialdehyde dehydrogenase/glutarate-semialdehyde dehydrogenase